MGSLADVRMTVSFLGRRDAMKFGLIGATAALAAACSGGSDESGGSGEQAVAAKSVLGQAISAFLVGKWTMDAPVVTDENTTYAPMTITVNKDGTWAIEYRGKTSGWGNTAGKWSFRDGTLKVHGFDNALDDNYFTELADIPKALAATALVSYRERNLVDEKEPAVGVAEFASALATWNGDTQELSFPVADGSGAPVAQAVLKKLSD